MLQRHATSSKVKILLFATLSINNGLALDIITISGRQYCSFLFHKFSIKSYVIIIVEGCRL